MLNSFPFVDKNVIFSWFNTEKIPTVLFLAELTLFIGIVLMIVIFGFINQKVTALSLLSLQISLIRSILYLSLVFLLLSLYVLFGEGSTSLTLSFLSYKVDKYTQLIKCCIIFISLALVGCLSLVCKKKINNSSFPEFILLFTIMVFLSFIMTSSTNFMLTLLALEGISLSSYIAASTDRSYGGIIASAKYYSFGTLGSIFILWGIINFYALTATVSYKSIFATIWHFSVFNNTAPLLFPSSLVIAGFIIKLGVTPFHTWVADVYAGSHIFITAIFSTFVKFVLFTTFLRIALYVNDGPTTSILAALSLSMGCFETLKQIEIKRFVAYSSIVHTGFILIGDLSSSLVYLLTYMLTNLLLFSVLINNPINGKEIIYFHDLRYLKHGNSYNFMLIIISLSSAAGLPPFAGFYAKYMTWLSLIEDIRMFNDPLAYCLLLLSFFLSLVTAFYYMRVIIYMLIGQESDAVTVKNVYYAIKDLKLLSSSNSIPSLLSIFLAVILCLWTFLHKYVLDYVNIAVVDLYDSFN